MSFDLALFFPLKKFCSKTWLAAIQDLGETREDPPPDDQRFGLRNWRTFTDTSVVFTTLSFVNDPAHFGVADKYRWRLWVEAGGGCPLTRWCQFSIPCRCLLYIDDVLAYDPQSHTVFDCPDAYWAFASIAVRRWPGLPRKLRRMGLMADNGALALECP